MSQHSIPCKTYCNLCIAYDDDLMSPFCIGFQGQFPLPAQAAHVRHHCSLAASCLSSWLPQQLRLSMRARGTVRDKAVRARIFLAASDEQQFARHCTHKSTNYCWRAAQDRSAKRIISTNLPSVVHHLHTGLSRRSSYVYYTQKRVLHMADASNPASAGSSASFWLAGPQLILN